MKNIRTYHGCTPYRYINKNLFARVCNFLNGWICKIFSVDVKYGQREEGCKINK